MNLVMMMKLSLVAVTALLSVLVQCGGINAAACSQHLNGNMTYSPDMQPPRIVTSIAACCELCWTTTSCVAAVYHSGLCHLKNFLGPIVTTDGYVTLHAELPCSALSNNMEACAMQQGCGFCQLPSGDKCYNTSVESCCGYAGSCGPTLCKVDSTCCMPGSGQCEFGGPQCCANHTGSCCSGYSYATCVQSGEQCCMGGQVCPATATCCSNTDPSSPYSICCDSGTRCCVSPGIEPSCCDETETCNDEQGCVSTQANGA